MVTVPLQFILDLVRGPSTVGAARSMQSMPGFRPSPVLDPVDQLINEINTGEPEESSMF